MEFTACSRICHLLQSALYNIYWYTVYEAHVHKGTANILKIKRANPHELLRRYQFGVVQTGVRVAEITATLGIFAALVCTPLVAGSIYYLLPRLISESRIGDAF